MPDKEETEMKAVNGDRIIPRPIEEEMKTSYINYSMSVIVGRALPDVRDGLKPVHRRILYAMRDLGLSPNKPYKKSARVVGEVLGKYHPHGDMAVYDAMVRMVQDFSLRYPLVGGQGNFGSVDGDSPAAMRYTEVRLAGISDEVLSDIDKNTVDFVPNFDGSLEEPALLPSLLPNLLLNGSSGIAVGMATNIPPHNLGEVVDGIFAALENPEIATADLIKIIKGPDFPTAGIITGRQGIKDYFETGRGQIRIRSKTEIEEIKGGRQAILVTELPYQVNKANLLEQIADLVREKKIEDISDLRDESDREGMRIVIEVKRDGNANVVLNQLFKHTPMESTFGVIMLALVDQRPRVLSMRQMLQQYIQHRELVITRRSRFELEKATARAHILEGLKVALENLNAVVKIIRESKDADTARAELMNRFKLSRIQAQAILEMRLVQLTGLERKKIDEEHAELLKTIAELQAILADPKKVVSVLRGELEALKKKYADDRRTRIMAQTVDLEMDDLISREEVVVTLSHAGYIKRLPIDTYHAQKRGGRGVTGMATREEDFVEQLFVTSTHAYLLLFTNRGRVFWIRVYELPDASRTARGKAIVNLVQLSPDEKITSSIPIATFEEEKGKETCLIMCTRSGAIKKTPLSEFSNIRRSGIIAIDLEEGDVLVDVRKTDGRQEVILGTRDGMAIRFPEEQVRSMGRGAHGVRGIHLREKDLVVGMEVAPPKTKATILTACENGHGKRTDLEEYRGQNRGGVGVITIKTTERNGKVVGIRLVTDDQDLMLMTASGKTIRLPVKDVSVISRNTQGVRLVRMEAEDRLAAIANIVKENGDDKKAV